ncbi:bifunctional S-adenosyl-L-methionine-dependent methyltransferase superfamily/Adrift-type ribose 2-O-methyltransferase domain/Ribosomal RNA methyltransferase [Babesia duncani]|uniref:Cap-specific mRNA (nucleoside-2'-O-)-methyltransferase 2 n=1 Tax=Babesia duncani TaxID=323732 RepID=A0AAD9PMD9_9APIC|nr:bifunctional S-adenosyl-L-methionine-dependent methyltransferase superfamily/Adrift-type ribose 2-O-methyltransferase domain/Ribosomal RNA methyltransferase [Babesia duncani]
MEVSGVQAIQSNGRYAFQSNLNKLFADSSRIPQSRAPCAKCSSRKRVCLCESISTLVGRADPYTIEDLVPVKGCISAICDGLNNLDIEAWSAHTKLLDETSLLVKHVSDISIQHNGNKVPGVELVTNAWLKFYEILVHYDLVKFLKPKIETEAVTLHSFHISECPGGFIAALNHYIKSKNLNAKLAFKAISLNPYYEANSHNIVLAEDILYRETADKWLCGVDNSGNVISVANIEYVWDRITGRGGNTRQNREGGPPILMDLCTADGSFNCQHDPNNQEVLTAPLKFAEVVCALGLIRIGGVFVIKMFSLLEESSLSLVAILSACFKRVEVYKPALSKRSSSEVYLVCMDFLGISSTLLCALCKRITDYGKILDQNGRAKAILPQEWIPPDFKLEFIDCAKMFAQRQARNLRHTMAQFKGAIDENCQYKKKREFAQAFVKQFDIKPIDPESRLVPPCISTRAITGKDTSSLGHVPKRHLPSLEIRQQFHLDCIKLRKERRGLEKTFRLDLNLPAPEVPPLLERALEFSRRYDPGHKFETLSGHDPENGEITPQECTVTIDPEGWRAELEAAMRAQEYIRSNWFTVVNIRPHDFNFSFFACNDLLHDAIAIRAWAGGALPITAADAVMQGSSIGEVLSDINAMPSAGAFHLAMVMRKHLNIERYKTFVEITCNMAQEFPAICILKRHGINGSILYDLQPGSDKGPFIHFESPYELQVILGGFCGEGTIERCLQYNYKALLQKQAPYKELTADFTRTSLAHSCDFVFCDVVVNGMQCSSEIAKEEIEHRHLLVAQIIQALNCLKDDGDLVIAWTSCFTRFTSGILLILACAFEKVHLYQPETDK